MMWPFFPTKPPIERMRSPRFALILFLATPACCLMPIGSDVASSRARSSAQYASASGGGLQRRESAAGRTALTAFLPRPAFAEVPVRPSQRAQQTGPQSPEAPTVFTRMAAAARDISTAVSDSMETMLLSPTVAVLSGTLMGMALVKTTGGVGSRQGKAWHAPPLLRGGHPQIPTAGTD